MTYTKRKRLIKWHKKNRAFVHFLNPWTRSISAHRLIEPYISIKKESIEKERIKIDRYIS